MTDRNRNDGDITALLRRWNRGDADALRQLIPVVYDELHDIARSYLQSERANHTLQPTALVNEAYLRLTGVRRGSFQNRVHFFGAAAQTMRRVLVDHARQHSAHKRGSGQPTVSLDEAISTGISVDHELLALDRALDDLARIAPRPARVVELRYFGGLSVDEAAVLLEVAPVTVKRHWAYAKAWLYRAMSRSGAASRQV